MPAWGAVLDHVSDERMQWLINHIYQGVCGARFAVLVLVLVLESASKLTKSCLDCKSAWVPHTPVEYHDGEPDAYQVRFETNVKCQLTKYISVLIKSEIFSSYFGDDLTLLGLCFSS